MNTQQRSIALYDANNFYYSCESVFDPKLRNKPVVILSNNDGCAISRSNEAKALGIPMGAPWFKLKEVAEEHGIIARSSNYALYADMSNRFMSLLGEYSPDQEIYSIDECFLDLTTLRRVDHVTLSQNIRSRILQGIGLPICGGIGSTKTLAKLANHCAKRIPVYNGVCNFNIMATGELDSLLSNLDVKEVWGVGRRLVPKLKDLGVMTALDLKRADPERMRQLFSVVMEKTIRELNGNLCIELEDIVPPRKQILSSRSFGKNVIDMQGLSESISLYVSRAAEKLRKQRSNAGSITVFIRTSPFIEEYEQYSKAYTVSLPTQSDDTSELVGIALWALKKIFRPGFKYAKAGIMLGDLVPASGVQKDLFFSEEQSPDKKKRLMTALDTVNSKMGRNTLIVGSQGFTRPWQMKQDCKSKSFTTNWDELLVVD